MVLAKAGGQCHVELNTKLCPPSPILFRYLQANRKRMQNETVEIEIYDKRQKVSTTIHVIEIKANIFVACENELFDCRLSYGTEFETRLNSEGKHEVIKILKTGDL
jgi:hypothetical protein